MSDQTDEQRQDRDARIKAAAELLERRAAERDAAKGPAMNECSPSPEQIAAGMPRYGHDGRTLAQVDKAFTYHPPKPDQVPRYTRIRDEAKALALRLASDCPPSRELSLALTHLEDAVMWANAAIARNET